MQWLTVLAGECSADICRRGRGARGALDDEGVRVGHVARAGWSRGLGKDQGLEVEPKIELGRFSDTVDWVSERRKFASYNSFGRLLCQSSGTIYSRCVMG